MLIIPHSTFRIWQLSWIENFQRTTQKWHDIESHPNSPISTKRIAILENHQMFVSSFSSLIGKLMTNTKNMCMLSLFIHFVHVIRTKLVILNHRTFFMQTFILKAIKTRVKWVDNKVMKNSLNERNYGTKTFLLSNCWKKKRMSEQKKRMTNESVYD